MWWSKGSDQVCVRCADLPTALARVSSAWLIAMPVAACNLILVTAVEDKALVGDPLFGHVLPLAARGVQPHFPCSAYSTHHHLMHLVPRCWLLRQRDIMSLQLHGELALHNDCSRHLHVCGEPHRVAPHHPATAAQARGSPS